MKGTRAASSTFLMLTLGASCALSGPVRAGPAPATGALHLTVLVEPAAGDGPVVRALNAAQRTIFVQCYLLSDRRIVRALERAQAQGVHVFVALEQHPYGLGSQPERIADELRAAGIALRWTPHRFALTHAKLMVLDDRLAIISTANFSTAGFHTDRDFVAFDAAPADVRQLSSLFRADWDRLPAHIVDTALIVAPDTARRAVDALVASAGQSIDIYAEEVVDPHIETLLARQARHRRVRLLLPPGASLPAVHLLVHAGVHVRVLSNPYIHAKAIIIDRHRGYIGSENLSTQSLDRNREVGVWLDERALRVVERQFVNDWNVAAAAR